MKIIPPKPNMRYPSYRLPAPLYSTQRYVQRAHAADFIYRHSSTAPAHSARPLSQKRKQLDPSPFVPSRRGWRERIRSCLHLPLSDVCSLWSISAFDEECRVTFKGEWKSLTSEETSDEHGEGTLSESNWPM